MEKHRKTYYKYCLVPMCQNNTKTAPDKVYFLMPKDPRLRKKWCKMMRKDDVSCLSCLYCCEDHFNIEKDTVNYMQYKIMALEHGEKVTLRLKKGVFPYIFQCQKKGKLQTPPERKAAMKRKRLALVEEALAEAALIEANLPKAGPCSTSLSEVAKTGPSVSSVPHHMDLKLNNSDNKIDGGAACKTYLSNAHHSKDLFQLDKAVPVDCKAHYRSKGVNVNLIAKKNDIALSPILIPCKNTSTSPLKSAQSSSVKGTLFLDSPTDNVSLTNVHFIQSTILLTTYELEHSSSDSSWLNKDESDSDLQFMNLMHSGTFIAIEKEPEILLGLP